MGNTENTIFGQTQIWCVIKIKGEIQDNPIEFIITIEILFGFKVRCPG
jgi:hypothetical protein